MCIICILVLCGFTAGSCRHDRSVQCIGSMCIICICKRGYTGGSCRHGHWVGERPSELSPVNASAIVEGHVLQSMAVWAGGFKPFLVSFSCGHMDQHNLWKN